MQGIYICNYDLKNSASGVSKKISSQLQVFRNAGIDMLVLDHNCLKGKIQYGFLHNLLIALKGCSSMDTLELLKIAEHKIRSDRFDFIYFRKGLFDAEQIDVIKRIKKIDSQIKIIIEIATYPYDKELKWYRWPWIRNDKLARRQIKGCVDRIVTYSRDKEIFHVPTISISNGIVYNSVPLKNVREHIGINLIAVALFAEWHGYDRVIEGMYQDIEIVRNNSIHLHLVGSGKVLGKYKKMVEKYGLSEFVHFYGKKDGTELDDIYDTADIGLDSMGRHRAGCFYNSTLKGKEYCAHGLPIISGVQTELDDCSDFEYYLRIPADDSPVKMQELVDFYHRVYDRGNNIPKIIREKTENMFDLEKTFLPVIDYIIGYGMNTL